MVKKILLILVALSAGLNTFAASDPDYWRKDLNDNFEVTCGDHVSKVPFDQNDLEGIIIGFSSGKAAVLSNTEMGRYGADSIGYKVSLSTSSAEIFGTNEPVKTVLNCNFQENSTDMTCFSDLQFDSVKSIPGFNSFTVKLPIPRKRLVNGSAEFTVRRAEKIEGEKYFGHKYSRSTREAICKYKPI